MSDFGGGGSRGRGGGRGRSHGGRGGPRGRGGGIGGGRPGGGGGPQDPGIAPARFKPCKAFTTTGSCPHQNNCNFSHIVTVHAQIEASSRKPQQQQQKHHSYNPRNDLNQNLMEPVSSVALWEAGGAIKIFSGSHDGHWRLWNTSGGTFVKEFEHSMGGGKVECLEVASNFLFCGFEGTSIKVPAATVGMIHAWNLSVPTDPPLEFHMAPLAPYAHAKGVSCLVAAADTILSGSHDGVIRLWRFDAAANGGKGGFALGSTMHGHAGEVTGLAVVSGSILWSGSIDETIRLWDLTNGECKYLITRDAQGNKPLQSGVSGAVSGVGVGHTAAVTSILPFESPAGNFVLSSSLDGTVKAWNGTNGECMASETHGDGVISMALSSDLKGNPLLLVGLERGNIFVRSVLQTPSTPAFCLLFSLSYRYTCGHDGPVKSIRAGPSNTFYSGGDDGMLIVWQITGDLGL